MFFIVSFTLSCNVTMDDGKGGKRENKDCGGEASCVREGGWLISDHDSYMLAKERILSLMDRRRSVT